MKSKEHMVERIGRTKIGLGGIRAKENKIERE